jgi:hypothetical protein
MMAQVANSEMLPPPLCYLVGSIDSTLHAERRENAWYVAAMHNAMTFLMLFQTRMQNAVVMLVKMSSSVIA